ncbi:glycosyltransferase [Candidatus Sumerlaeota bacterium]|nr:glycosyltransferase [Candidatus Sumerlaeota bacterium]
MKVALIHDWLIGMRGGEKVLEQLCQLFPSAEIFTLFYLPENVSPIIRGHRVHSSMLQKIPGSLRYYRYLLPLYPEAVKRWKLGEFDLIISISHCVAKGVRVHSGTPHICYCLTPMRYIWDNFDSYFAPERSSFIVRTAMKMVRPYLQRWDVRSTSGVDYFVAISRFVARRIKNYYQRQAEIIYPPVDTDFFQPLRSTEKENFYLIVSALVPYKRIDIAVAAFNKLNDKKLKIVGVGPEYSRLKRMCNHSNIEFLCNVAGEELRRLYQKARALIFCGEEDFGIAMVEAQACGTPVVAFARGGATEIVTHKETGLLFSEQSADALIDALLTAEQSDFSPELLRQSALRFSAERFRHQFKCFIQHTLGGQTL